MVVPGATASRVFDIPLAPEHIPFGLELVTAVQTPGEEVLVGAVECGIHANAGGGRCGWTFRDLAGSNMDACGVVAVTVLSETLTFWAKVSWAMPRRSATMAGSRSCVRRWILSRTG